MLFIINPISGVKSKKRIVAYLEKNGLKYVFTKYAGHAFELAKDAQARIIVAVGGDGTVNEVARAICGTDKVLGIVPCGSGDGLALHLGLSRHYKRAIRDVLAGNVIQIDSAKVGTRAFFTVCGVGFDAQVSKLFSTYGARGVFAYLKLGLKTWIKSQAQKYTLEIDNHSMVVEAMMITVGNGNQWGNQAKIAPLASISDGLLDVTVTRKFSLFYLPFVLFLLMTGKLHKSRHVTMLRGKIVRVGRLEPGPAHADGDWFEGEPVLTISVSQRNLDIIVPRSCRL